MITGCSFVGNEASNSGGGIELQEDSFMSNCDISGNTAAVRGGGVFLVGSTVTECRIFDNSAPMGGGIHGSGIIQNCTVSGNSSPSGGGGIHGSGLIQNCTVSGNSAPSGSGVWLTSSTTIQNSIIAFGELGQAVVCFDNSTPTLVCCDVYGNQGGDWVGCIAGQLGVNGNISEDPLFCNRAAGDLGLCSDSPCTPDHSGGCGLIGALPVGCGACGSTPVEPVTWGQIKFRARR
jgi:predicted outer membrane repeat protein